MFLGLVVLILGLFACANRVRLGTALALVALSFVGPLMARAFTTVTEFAAWHEIAMLGPALTPRDLARGNKIRTAREGAATLGLALGLLGSAAALARSIAPGERGTASRDERRPA